MSTTEQQRITFVSTPRIGWTVALSLVFYLMALAAGIGYDHRFRHAASDTSPSSAPVGAVNASRPSLIADQPAGMLLEQAHDCALAHRWTCMRNANATALALQGTGPAGDATQAQASAAPTLAAAAVVLAATRPSTPSTRHHPRDGVVRVSGNAHAARHRPIRQVAYHWPAEPTAPRRPDPFFANLYRH